MPYNNPNGNINRVILVGHIVREPRWHTGDKTRQLCFTFMTKETIHSPSGDMDHEELHQIRIDEDNPALKRIDLKKDDVLSIQGKLHTNAFTDELNVRRYKTIILANSIELFAITPQLQY